MIEVRGVYKSFGETIALNGVSLAVHEGETLGLLGPNGSGKTTLLNTIVGLIRPDSGEVFVDGASSVEDPTKAKQIVGYLPEEIAIYESLTPKEFFDFIASVRRMKGEEYERRLNSLVEAFGIKERVNDYTGSLSRGNRQKVAIISTLIHSPKVLLLDEPLIGLDPASVRVFKEILKDYARRGCAIILSTHILEVAESLCSRIVIIDRGRIIADGNMNELRSTVRQDATLEEVFLKVTHVEETLEEAVRALREAI